MTLDAHVQSRLREIAARERSQREEELQSVLGELHRRLDEMRQSVSSLGDEAIEARAARAEEATAAAATEAAARGEAAAESKQSEQQQHQNTQKQQPTESADEPPPEAPLTQMPLPTEPPGFVAGG